MQQIARRNVIIVWKQKHQTKKNNEKKSTNVTDR